MPGVYSRPRADKGLHPPVGAAMHAGWSLLLYLAGGCELEPHMCRRLWTLEQAFRPEVEVLLQLGQASGVRRYRVRPAGSDPGGPTFGSECLQDLGSVNLADPQALYEFLRWGLAEASAARTLLVLAGHGTGIFGALTDTVSGPPQIMGIPGTCAAMVRAQSETGRRIDVLLYDTCFMNLVEAAYEMAMQTPPAASYLLVPVENSPLEGLPYEELVELLAERSEEGSGDSSPDLRLTACLAAEQLSLGLSGRGFPAGVACLSLDPALWRSVAAEARRLGDCLSAATDDPALAAFIRPARLRTLLTSATGAAPDRDPCGDIVRAFRDQLSQTVLLSAPGVPEATPYKCYSMYLPVGGRASQGCVEVYRELSFARDTELLDRRAADDRLPPGLPELTGSSALPGPTVLPAQIWVPSQLSAEPSRDP